MHEATCVAGHRRLAQLLRAHFTEPFESRHGHLAPDFLRVDAIKDALSLAVIERIENFLADIDAIEWGHRYVDVPRQHEIAKVAQE